MTVQTQIEDYLAAQPERKRGDMQALHDMMLRPSTLLVALCASGALVLLRAQSTVDSLVPPGAPNCRVTTPPAAAGISGTPGGFVMVFPRNDALPDQYTGCKMLWIVDTDRTPRLATLYFERGQLARAVSHDVRDPSGAVEGACALPEGKSLLPNAGRRYGDAACRGFAGETLYALRLPTWPRRCMTKPDAPACVADPR